MSTRCRHNEKISLHEGSPSQWLAVKQWWCPECGALSRKKGVWRYPKKRGPLQRAEDGRFASEVLQLEDPED